MGWAMADLECLNWKALARVRLAEDVDFLHLLVWNVFDVPD